MMQIFMKLLHSFQLQIYWNLLYTVFYLQLLNKIGKVSHGMITFGKSCHGEEDKCLRLKLFAFSFFFAFSNLSITGYNSLGYWNLD